jgi:hypothetical protein
MFSQPTHHGSLGCQALLVPNVYLGEHLIRPKEGLDLLPRSALEVLLRFCPLELGEDDEDGDLVLGGLTWICSDMA